MSEHGKGHLDGVDTGKLDKDSVGAHIVGVLRTMAEDTNGHVGEENKARAQRLIGMFDMVKDEEAQKLLVAEFAAEQAQMVVALIMGTHGLFGQMVNELVKATLSAVNAAGNEALVRARTPKDLDNIDMSNVKFVKE